MFILMLILLAIVVYEIHAYGTIQEFVDRHKGYIDEPLYNVPVDLFYLTPENQLIVSVNLPDDPPRPDYSRSVIIVQSSKLSKYYDTEKLIKVLPTKTVYDPNYYICGRILFNPHKYLFFTKGCDLWLKCDRFIGLHRPTKKTKVAYNWFYNHTKRIISFVLTSSY